MELLENPIRGYAWGSRTTIGRLQGRAVPTAGPEAELWMGAHPDSPSTVRRDGRAVSVAEVVAADSGTVLGPAVLARFGPRLPFMLKVLAAESPLSLQAHPDSVTAAAGYAAEEAAGVPHGDPRRTYVDPYAKPELLVAVDHFDTLCGFRDPAASAADIAALGVGELDRIVGLLRTGTVAQRLRGAVSELLCWPDDQRAATVAAVVAAIRRRPVPTVPGPPVTGTRAARGLLDHVADLGTRFPRDLGVVVAILLNHVELAPDEAIHLPAGNMHAYLRGTGIEVLAASDNVLRGGLTAKHVNVGELLRALRFEVLADPVVRPVTVRPGVLSWQVPVAEFALFRVDVHGDEPVDLPITGPRIAFCLHGRVTIDDGTPIPLTSGTAAFGPAGHPLSVTGDGTAFVATVLDRPSC